MAAVSALTGTVSKEHWDAIYASKREDELSWFQRQATPSLELIQRSALPPSARVLDVGGGASCLVDDLLARGFEDVTVLDVSDLALAAARARLGERATRVRWIAADVTSFEPTPGYALWHDRAVFHFLTSEAERASYVRALERALPSGGVAIVGTFALDGPERCSGLPVVRYDAAGLAAALGPSFSLVDDLRHEHVTPGGKVQAFTFVRVARA